MKIELERVAPMEIEARSFEIIGQELKHPVDPTLEPIVKRVIHTTADFDYADTLCFSEGVVEKALDAINGGAAIVTDTTDPGAGAHRLRRGGRGPFRRGRRLHPVHHR